jgi:hypothetical protein
VNRILPRFPLKAVRNMRMARLGRDLLGDLFPLHHAVPGGVSYGPMQVQGGHAVIPGIRNSWSKDWDREKFVQHHTDAKSIYEQVHALDAWADKPYEGASILSGIESVSHVVPMSKELLADVPVISVEQIMRALGVAD